MVQKLSLAQLPVSDIRFGVFYILTLGPLTHVRKFYFVYFEIYLSVTGNNRPVARSRFGGVLFLRKWTFLRAF